MKTALVSFLSLALLVTLAGCGAAPTPDQSIPAGMSKAEYQQLKEQSARMGMSAEDHTKMLDDSK